LAELEGKTVIRGLVAVFLAFGLTATAHADVVHLRNGRTLRGVSVQRGVSELRVITTQGSLLLHPDQVLRVEHTDTPQIKPEIPALPSLLAAPPLSEIVLEVLGRAVRDAYRSGSLDLARGLLASHPAAHSAFELPPSIVLSATRVGGELKLVLRLAGSQPALVAIPPATLAAPRAREGGGVPLALLRAPVVVLSPRRPETTIRVPLAWALFAKRASSARPLRLYPAPEDGSFARVLRALCASEGATGPAAQLALWIASGDIEREDLLRSGSQLTCSKRLLVLPLHGKGAAAILERAGVSQRDRAFFRTEGLPPLPASPVGLQK
jgi:hypothetical protein